MKGMQCKDIPDQPILEFLLLHEGHWCNWCWTERNVAVAMPPGTVPKLVLGKMRQMISRGVVGGCPCGCRGDFEITAKGKAELLKKRNLELVVGALKLIAPGMDAAIEADLKDDRSFGEKLKGAKA